MTTECVVCGSTGTMLRGVIGQFVCDVHAAMPIEELAEDMADMLALVREAARQGGYTVPVWAPEAPTRPGVG